MYIILINLLTPFNLSLIMTNSFYNIDTYLKCIAFPIFILVVTYDVT